MFYTYRQNSSGGSYDDSSTYVIIEAESAYAANILAEYYGIYFDGCDKNIDCRCCGDRWTEATESDGEEFIHIYNQPIKDINMRHMYKTDTVTISYLDGREETFNLKRYIEDNNAQC